MKLDVIEKKLDQLLAQKKEDDQILQGGVNIRNIKADTPQAYGLALLDVFFTKQELKRSLLVKSKISNKPALDTTKVNKIFKMIEEKYGHTKEYKRNWNPKAFIRAANQKCRDAMKPSKEEASKQDKVTGKVSGEIVIDDVSHVSGDEHNVPGTSELLDKDLDLSASDDDFEE